ncbi:MAG: DNA-formamidopyrimidine glycosylase family protein [Myxococcota bacterium]
MPEGDTIHRTARTLRRAIGGERINAYWTRLPSLRGAALEGRRVKAVRARGKNLLIDFDGGASHAPITMHTHMLMTGSWHIYRDGDRWKKPRRAADIVLSTPRWNAVAFSVPMAALLRSDSASSLLRRLGPDLLDPSVSDDSLLERLQADGGSPLGEALLRQSNLCGIGNVYKSEVCFIEGLNPFLPVAQQPKEGLRRTIRTARRLLKRNLRGASRITTGPTREQRLWVYGRSGDLCFRCDTAIAMRRQGSTGRSTYYCPACQNVNRITK